MSNFITTPLFSDLPHIKHGFFTRQGGASTGIFDSLNTGAGSSDDPASVKKNIAIIAKEMEIKPDQLQTLYQTHSAIVHAINTPQPMPEGDGMVTTKANIALGIKTADCVPILFACAKTGIIGACHAGWGGAFQGIAQNTIQKMTEQGANLSDIRAAIGPCLHQENFEVGDEFVARFVEQSRDNAHFFKIPAGKEKHHFDLIGYLKKCLTQSGIRRLETVECNTYTDEMRFFSYRRSCHKNEPDYGRQLSVILRTA